MCLQNHIKTSGLPKYIIGYKIYIKKHDGSLLNRIISEKDAPKQYHISVAEKAEILPTIKYPFGFHVYKTLAAAKKKASTENDVLTRYRCRNTIYRVILMDIVAAGREYLYGGYMTGRKAREAMVYVGKRMILLDEVSPTE